MIISIEAEKAFAKFNIYLSIHDKNSLSQLEIERNFLSLIKGTCKEPTAKTILYCAKPNASLLR